MRTQTLSIHLHMHRAFPEELIRLGDGSELREGLVFTGSCTLRNPNIYHPFLPSSPSSELILKYDQ